MKSTFRSKLLQLSIASFIALSVSATPFASAALPPGGGDVVGVGLAEKNVIYAFLNLATPLSQCLESVHCRLDDEEKKFISAILRSLPQEQANKNAIQFKSEREEPGFFLIEGRLRLARTSTT